MLYPLLHISPNQRQAGVVVDTNLLLLLLVGRLDLNRLRQFRATVKYDANAYYNLDAIVRYFLKVYCTTQIVTEVDNLSRQVGRAVWPVVSAALFDLISECHEEALSSSVLLAESMHAEFGVTDCSILDLAREGRLVVTDDLPLTILLQRKRLNVLNLSHYLG